jgi:hypothetical protein
MFCHNILRKHLQVMDFVIISHLAVGKNLNRRPKYYISVML